MFASSVLKRLPPNARPGWYNDGAKLEVAAIVLEQVAEVAPSAAQSPLNV
jgi:hypothetical protein